MSSGDLTFDFLVAFLKNGLIDLRREFIGDYPHGLHSSYLTIVHACFMAAAKVPGNTPEVLCGSGSQRPSSGGQPRPCPPCITAVDHICTLVKLCLSEEEVRPLLNSVLETALPSEEGDPDELWMMLGDFFIPLILRIMEMLSGVSQTVASPPFNAFFHHLIRISLKRLFDPEEYVPLFTVHTLDPGEYHLSQQIHAHHDVARLVRLGTVAHSHHERMFELRRKAKAVGLDDWTRRQTAVRLVLQYIGDLDALLAIMGRVMLDKAHRVL